VRAPARESARKNQKPWPADKVEGRALGDRPADPVCENARTHTDAQVAAIAASIKEWGWTTPALVGEDGGLIAGHARVLAARQLGIAEIPVMLAAGWTEAQKRAYVLADNQLAISGSGWDPELLRLELGELKLGGFDLSLTGFGELELAAGGRGVGRLLSGRDEGATTRGTSRRSNSTCAIKGARPIRRRNPMPTLYWVARRQFGQRPKVRASKIRRAGLNRLR